MSKSRGSYISLVQLHNNYIMCAKLKVGVAERVQLILKKEHRNSCFFTSQKVPCNEKKNKYCSENWKSNSTTYWWEQWFFTLWAGRTSPLFDWNSIRVFPINPVCYKNKKHNIIREHKMWWAIFLPSRYTWIWFL